MGDGMMCDVVRCGDVRSRWGGARERNRAAETWVENRAVRMETLMLKIGDDLSPDSNWDAISCIFGRAAEQLSEEKWAESRHYATHFQILDEHLRRELQQHRAIHVVFP